MEPFSINKIRNALIVGGGHGIGLALVRALVPKDSSCRVYVTYRPEDRASELFEFAGERSSSVTAVHTNSIEESSLESLRDGISKETDHLDLIINCMGVLDGESGRPEKSLRDISVRQLSEYFAVNSMITPLLAKVFRPLLRSRELSLFASISEKVGSIGDNRLGGWYGYRASKAALNMFVKNISLEFSQHNIPCVVLSIHPGTTETALSKAYIARSKLKIHSPEETAKNILSVIDKSSVADSGKFLDWQGIEVPW